MGSGSQPPHPQYLMQLPVCAYLASRPRCCPVVLAQELVMKPHRQHAQDLHRVVGIRLRNWLSAHNPARYQRTQTVNESSRPGVPHAVKAPDG
jgi:hypothetical protein